MENINNNVITFANPETAYLYGLGQSTKAICEYYKSSGNGSIHKEYVSLLREEINNIHRNAMQVLNNSKLNLVKNGE